MKSLSIRNISFAFFLCLLGVACSDNSSGNMENSGSATFKGRVESTSSSKKSANSTSAVEGAVVTAARVNADGSLETIDDSQAETNAEGEYTLQVDLSAMGDAANRIVIVAENSGQKGKAFVSSEVGNGSTITVEPITVESSAEADVYQQVVANGDEDTVTKAEISVFVDADVAADIESNTQNAAKIAAALESSAEAKSKFYADQGIEVSEDMQNQIMQAKEDAEVQLESDLNAATSTEAKESAYDTFAQAVANAEINAGVDAWAAAESNNMAAHIMLKNTADFSSDARAEIRRHVSYYTAITIDAAAQAQAKAAGASDATINAIADAGSTLRASIKNVENASEKNIDDAFVQYNESVQGTVNNDSNLNGSAFVNVNTAISGSAGLKNTLESSLDASANADAMMSAYSDFSSQINSLVKSSFNSAGDAEVQAYTRLLVLINLA